MTKKLRQYTGLFAAVLAYYVVHEGAHLAYALGIGAFQEIRFLGLGVQIDVFARQMTDIQMGIFCLAGSMAALAAAYVLVLLTGRICRRSGAVFKACMYYMTAALLLIDPLYLSILCGFFGGGDMNGISLLFPEPAARRVYGILLVVNAAVFAKIVLPQYRESFGEAVAKER